MAYKTLIVPGLHNSGPDHWQTWLEGYIGSAVRVHQEDWRRPAIGQWATNVKQAIESSEERIILVAHSFGVLASIVAASIVPDRVAGALYVAPADPSRFSLSGQRMNQDSSELQTGLFELMPIEKLGYPVVLAASTNDDCMPFKRTAWWSKKWGARLISLGDAGHVNSEAGFGPWPQGLDLYNDVVNRSRINDREWNQLIRWAY